MDCILSLWLHYVSVKFSCSVMSNSLQPPWIAARQVSLSNTNSRSSPKLMPFESVIPFSHLILCHPLLLLPPIPPSIRVTIHLISCSLKSVTMHINNYLISMRRKWQPFQYSCLKNPMDRGAWRAIVHGVTKSWTQLKRLNMHLCIEV